MSDSSLGLLLLLVTILITVLLFVAVVIREKRFAKKSFPFTSRLLERFSEETLKAVGKEVFLVSEKYGRVSVDGLSNNIKHILLFAEKGKSSINTEHIRDWEKGVFQVIMRELEEHRAHFSCSTTHT